MNFLIKQLFFLLRVLPELKGFVNSHRKQPESKKALEISTPQEFEAQIVSGTSLVNFYTADCEASKKLAPTIDKLATQYANTADIEVVKVDCGKQELQGLCENEEVSTFLRVSVQGVKSLGGHFACLCREFDFYEVKKILFFKKKWKYFYTFNHF